MNLGKTIAEDNDSKFARIEDFLKQEFEDLEITRFAYAKGVVIELKTLNDLKQNNYDFLIQDMQMPLNIDGRIDTQAGQFVLEQLKFRQIKIKTIVCSSEEQTVPNDIGFVKFVYGTSDWKRELINQIKKLK
jgi:CheY-like chemotaxis protein